MVRRGRSSGNSVIVQTRAVLSSLPVSTDLPSGLNATEKTRSMCVSGGPTGLPVATFQSRAVLSWLPVSTVFPSGLNATAQIRSLCSSAGPKGSRVAMFQSGAVL